MRLGDMAGKVGEVAPGRPATSGRVGVRGAGRIGAGGKIGAGSGAGASLATVAGVGCASDHNVLSAFSNNGADARASGTAGGVAIPAAVTNGMAIWVDAVAAKTVTGTDVNHSPASTSLKAPHDKR